MLIPLILIVVFTVAAFIIIDHFYQKSTISRHENNLVNLAQGGARALAFLSATNRFRTELIRLALRESGMPYLPEDFSTIDDYDNFADAFTENSPFRVTIIDIDGKVLGDSQLTRDEVRAVENHADRPEVVMAREEGVGVSRRRSATLKLDLLYTAVRYNSLGAKGYFRVALPMAELNKDITQQRVALGTFCTITVLAGIVISLLMSKYLTNLFRKKPIHPRRTYRPANKRN